MEVYTAVYSADGERLTEVAPVIVENIDSLGISETEAESVPPRCINPNLSAPRGQLTLPTRDAGILFIGDGVQKCESVLSGPGRWFRQECPTAEAMRIPALRELQARHFRDTAYFEPFYLKDFVATVGKKFF